MLIRKCEKCGYTMREVCRCGKTKSAHPPRFSLSDKYAKYRRMIKKNTN